ncbi:hypothetical protein TNCV_934611 [Trichonephila clavipes]|nr:hypothetical protein TNCV_934611 [Trichonephila clavipes]
MPGENFWRRPRPTQSCRAIKEEEVIKAVETTFQYFKPQGSSIMDVLYCIMDCSTEDNRVLLISLKMYPVLAKSAT